MQTYYVMVHFRNGDEPKDGIMKAVNLSNLRKNIIQDGLSKTDKIDYIHISSNNSNRYFGRIKKEKGWTGPEYTWTDKSGGKFKRYINPKTGELKPVERRP